MVSAIFGEKCYNNSTSLLPTFCVSRARSPSIARVFHEYIDSPVEQSSEQIGDKLIDVGVRGEGEGGRGSKTATATQ